MVLVIEQYQGCGPKKLALGVVGRKHGNVSSVITDSDCVVAEQAAKDYGFDQGYFDCQLVNYGVTLDHIILIN